jgi:hypothetical protein
MNGACAERKLNIIQRRITALDSAPARLSGINKLYVHWRNTTDGDHRRFCATGDDSIIVRRTSDSPNITADRSRDTIVGIKIVPAVYPPNTRHDDTKTIGGVVVRRTHIARVPLYKGEIDSFSIEAAGQHCVFKTILGKPFLACPLYRIRHSNLGLAEVNLAHGNLSKTQTFDTSQ